MRRQNPPEIQLNRASEIERYQKPLILVGIYVSIAVLYCLLIVILFIILTYTQAFSVSTAVITVFTMVAVVPATLIAFAWFLRPRDPVSMLLAGAAADLRSPITLPADSCVFKTRLMGGEALCVNLAFYYPAESHSGALQERLYSSVRTALAQNFSTRRTPPDAEEIERAIDHPMESLAAEYGIAIFYAEVREVLGRNDEGEQVWFKTGTSN